MLHKPESHTDLAIRAASIVNIERTRPRLPIAFDPSATSARRLDGQAMPSSFLFSAGGQVLHVHRGFRLEVRAGLERRLQAAVA